MSIKIEDLCPSFPSIDNAPFKRKVYEACTIFAMENYDVLRKTQSEDMFPSEKFYTLEDQVKCVKITRKTSSLPKKKRIPIRKSNKPVVEKPDVVTDDEDNKDDAKEENKSSVRKIYPLILNRNAKSIIDFIVGRFLWEVYSIEPDDVDDFPDSKTETEQFILEHVVTDFDNKCNISQLIINSVKVFQPNKIISNSHGIDKEIRGKFGEHLASGSFANVSADYLTEFLKLLIIYFSNKFWLEKSQTVNIKTFDTILRYIELVIPITCNTVSNGLLKDIYNYDKLVNPIKSSSDKDNKKSDNKKSDNKKSSSDKDNKKSDNKKSDNKKSDNKKSDNKKSDNKKSDNKKSDKNPPKEKSDENSDSEDESPKKVIPKRSTRSSKKNKSEHDNSDEESGDEEPDETGEFDAEYPQSE
jgi:hypothetical protein